MIVPAPLGEQACRCRPAGDRPAERLRLACRACERAICGQRLMTEARRDRPMTLAINPDDGLVVVDMQYDFLPEGSLAVAGGDEIVPLINQLAKRFRNVVLTQDW